MRKLKVFVIDDEPAAIPDTGHIDLNTEWLEVLLMPDYGSDKSKMECLRDWPQHLWLWASDTFPKEMPDLILIDCRFKARGTATPELKSYNEQGDPRGLLHGAIYVARMFGRDSLHPFGFEFYSQNAAGYSEDPLAQTFIGFLLAMQSANSAAEEFENLSSQDIVSWCRDVLTNTKGGSPAVAWRPALASYRARLAANFDIGHAMVEPETKRRLIESLDRIIGCPPSKMPKGLGVLSWTRAGGKSDAVDVRSLFADQIEADRWSDGAGKIMREWLEALSSPEINHRDLALEFVTATLKEGSIKAMTTLSGRRIPNCVPYKYTVKNFAYGCVTVAWWVREQDACQKANGRKLVPSHITKIGLSQQAIDRYVERIGLKTWGELAEKLTQGMKSKMWPIEDHDLYWVVREWATQNNIRFPFGEIPIE